MNEMPRDSSHHHHHGKRCFVFDFFGVICSEIAPLWIRTHLPTIDGPSFHAHVIGPVDAGRRTPEDLFEKLAHMSGQTSEQVQKQWQELVQIDADIVLLMQEIKKSGARVALCSNAWSSFIRPILKTHALESLFDVIIISSELGIIKPNTEIFLKTAEKLGSDTHSCIYIDDNPVNVASAEQVGMKGIVYTSVRVLREELQNCT